MGYTLQTVDSMQRRMEAGLYGGEELRQDTFRSLASIREYQEQHPIIDPLDLIPRNRAQIETALAFHRFAELESIEESDVQTLILGWAELFADLFREICDRHQIPPVVFESNFGEFEQIIAEDIASMKWLMSELNGDVGISGIKMHILWKLTSLAKNTREELGLLLSLAFPHISNGVPSNQFKLKHVFFPYTNGKSLH